MPSILYEESFHIFQRVPHKIWFKKFLALVYELKQLLDGSAKLSAVRSESDLAPKANARWSSRSHPRYFQGRKPLNQSRLYCQIIRQLLFDDSKIAYLVENHIGLYVMSIFFTFIEVIREISTRSFQKCYLTGRKFQCYNHNMKKAKSRGSPHNSPQISKSIHRYDLSRIGI